MTRHNAAYLLTALAFVAAALLALALDAPHRVPAPLGTPTASNVQNLHVAFLPFLAHATTYAHPYPGVTITPTRIRPRTTTPAR